MKTICFYFQVHQPFRLKPFNFFDIGTHTDYFDDYANRSIMRKVAEKSYLPTNKLMLELIQKYGDKFKITYSISGCCLDQFEMYAPDVLDSFKRLAETGNVEFLAETYAHSLSALKSKEEFAQQVKEQSAKIKKLFGKKPTVFRNTELIYSDEIGEMVHEMGYKAMLTEGAKHILGWKSPNYLYASSANPKLKLLLKNFQLSDDIAFRFSNRAWADWPLDTHKFVGWLNQLKEEEEIVNLFMDYETFGEHQWEETGIFEFMRDLPNRVFNESNFSFKTPSEIIQEHQAVGKIHVPYPISWADEERDLTAWLGNELQNDAFNRLYALHEKIQSNTNPKIKTIWKYLQTSDHFYYMCTKWFSDGDVHKYFNPYETPYDAYVNFMNILSDFEILLKEKEKQKKERQQIKKMTEAEIKKEIKKLESTLQKWNNQKKKTSNKTNAKTKSKTKK